MALNASARLPISSLDDTSARCVRSPFAICRAVDTSARMGRTISCDANHERRLATARVSATMPRFQVQSEAIADSACDSFRSRRK